MTSHLHHQVTGAGSPVLLLHGIGRSRADWDEQHARLSDAHEVWSVDLPGFGASSPVTSSPPLPAIAAVLADFVRREVGSPVHVVGNSLGGAVAMQLAVDAPDVTRSLLLANSAGFGRSVNLLLRLATVPGLGERLLRPRPLSALQQEQALFHDPVFVTEARVRRGLALAADPGPAAMLRVLRSLGTPAGVRSPWRRTLVDRLSRSGLPVLVVWGRQDRILPSRHLRAASRILPDARRHLFEDTGHLPQVERADEFAALALEFWRASETSRAPGGTALEGHGDLVP